MCFLHFPIRQVRAAQYRGCNPSLRSQRLHHNPHAAPHGPTTSQRRCSGSLSEGCCCPLCSRDPRAPSPAPAIPAQHLAAELSGQQGRAGAGLRNAAGWLECKLDVLCIEGRTLQRCNTTRCQNTCSARKPAEESVSGCSSNSCLLRLLNSRFFLNDSTANVIVSPLTSKTSKKTLLIPPAANKVLLM